MILVKLCILFVCLCLTEIETRQAVYSNEFAVHIPAGKGAADQIASKHGFTNIGQVGFIVNCYSIILSKKKVLQVGKYLELVNNTNNFVYLFANMKYLCKSSTSLI